MLTKTPAKNLLSDNIEDWVLSKIILHERTIPLLLAAAIHVCLGVCIVSSATKYISLLPQSLKVSFVAPSSYTHGKKQQSKVDAIITNQFPVGKVGVKPAKQEEKNDGKQTEKQETSGRESADAKAISSAIIEPVFNASYLNNPAPIYPLTAKRDGIEGNVMLLVVVSSSGEAESVKISSSSGYRLLDEAARTAVSMWKFVPAKQYGSAISASVMVPIEFKLN